MATINLPTKKRKAIDATPKRIILFSKPKVGKTVICSHLPNNLILDCEQGTNAIDALTYPIKKIEDIFDVCKAIFEEGKKNGGKYPYDYITLDTLSALEEMAIPYAEMRYAKSPEGSKWFLADADGNLHPESGKARYGNIMHVPFGKGYQYVAETLGEVIDMVQKVCPKVILLAHSTEKTMSMKDKEVTILDLMLSKKSKFISAFKADAIGYVYRKGKKNYIDFSAGSDSGAGGRHMYLEKEHVMISEFINDEIVTHWDKIYNPEKK